MLEDYKKITRLADTINIFVEENHEPMVELDASLFKISYKKKDMLPFLGEKIFVRKQVAEKLASVQKTLSNLDSNLQLLVCYGYRTQAIQETYFKNALNLVEKMGNDLSEEDRLELAHSMSAHTKSAGHTVGGAVDLTLWDIKNNTEVDMGSQISEFGDVAYTFYPNLTPEQKENRLFLKKIMTDEGFAPFLGEWWHFSFGDKEWAFYYKSPKALYGLVEIKDIIL